LNDQELDKIMKDRSDNFLAYIAKASEEELLAEAEQWEKESSEIQIPKDVEENILIMAGKYNKQQNAKKTKKTFGRLLKYAAIIVLASTTILTVLVYNVDAIHVRVFDFLFKSHQEYVEVTPVERNEKDEAIRSVLPKEWNNFYYPAYLPDSYKFVEAETVGDAKLLTFQDDKDGILNFSQEPLDGVEMMVDNENVESGEISINGGNGFWTTKGNNTNLIWNHDDSVYMLSGPISLKEMTKIAENLEYMK